MIDRIIELLLFKSMYYLIPPLQTPLTIAQNSLPLPLICVGRLRELAISLEQSLAPYFTFPGVIDLDNFSPQTLRGLLNTLNPYPVGVFVGGGVSVEVQQEVEKVVLEHNVAKLYDLKIRGRYCWNQGASGTGWGT